MSMMMTTLSLLLMLSLLVCSGSSIGNDGVEVEAVKTPPSAAPTVTAADSVLETVYFVRHCDKVSEGLPCCSSLGYQRAEAWGAYFHTLLTSAADQHKHVKTDKTVQDVVVYSALANYDKKKSKLCRADLYFPSKGSCQKSQRLAMTALLLHKHLEAAPNTSPALVSSIEMKYCAEDTEKVLADVFDSQHKSRYAVVVWSREGIVDMLRSLHVDISDWPKSLETVYDLVFRYDVVSKKVSYTCYDFQKSSSQDCNAQIKTWLHDL